MKFSQNFIYRKLRLTAIAFITGSSFVMILPNYEAYLYLKACFYEPYKKFNSKIKSNKEINYNGVFAPTFYYNDFTNLVSKCLFGITQSFMLIFKYKTIINEVLEAHRDKELIRINSLLSSLVNQIQTFESEFDQIKIIHDLNTNTEEVENFEKNYLKAQQFIKNSFGNIKTEEEKELLNESLKNLVINKEDFITIIAKFNNINLNKVQTKALVENKLNSSKIKKTNLFDDNEYFKDMSAKSLEMFNKIKNIDDMVDKNAKIQKLTSKLEEINEQRYKTNKKKDISIESISEIMDKNKLQ